MKILYTYLTPDIKVNKTTRKYLKKITFISYQLVFYT